jgi:hypothetical protein
VMMVNVAHTMASERVNLRRRVQRRVVSCIRWPL